MKPMTDRVAVVAGATRGAGRGSARGLAEAGAFVYCTGRSVAGQPSPYGRPETIDETVDMISRAGGTALAVRVDHTDESAVAALFERVMREHRRVDVVVNCIAGEDPMAAQWGSFWDANLENGVAIFQQAILSHIITAKHAAKAMKEARSGLIIEVTENDILSAGGNPLTQTVKLALKGIALNLAAELKTHNVAVIAITPGFLRSESMLERHGVTEHNWRDAGKKDPNFLESESPLFVGRAVATLATAPDLMARSGQLTSSWEVGREFQLTDYDGRRPDWGRLAIDFSVLPPWFVDVFRTTTEMHLNWLRTLTARTEAFLDRIPR